MIADACSTGLSDGRSPRGSTAKYTGIGYDGKQAEHLVPHEPAGARGK